MKEHIAEIVAAYVGHNKTTPEQLPALIASLNVALSGLGQSAAPEAATLSPAVPIRRSISPEKITCLDCGWSGQMLKRHLFNAHRLSPGQYRVRWKLAADFPMTSKNYSSRRSELAKAFGLGMRGGRRRVHSDG